MRKKALVVGEKRRWTVCVCNRCPNRDEAAILTNEHGTPLILFEERGKPGGRPIQSRLRPLHNANPERASNSPATNNIFARSFMALEHSPVTLYTAPPERHCELTAPRPCGSRPGAAA